MFGGFYKHNIAKYIPAAHVIFTLMGYKRNRDNDTLILLGPVDPDRLSRVSLDCLVASLECSIMIEIAEKLKGVNWTWQDVHIVRKENVSNVDEAVEILRSKISNAIVLPVAQNSILIHSNQTSMLPNCNRDSSQRTKSENLVNISNVTMAEKPILRSQQILPSNKCLMPTKVAPLSSVSTPVLTNHAKLSDKAVRDQSVKKPADANNVIIPAVSNSIINGLPEPLEDKSVRPKVRKTKTDTGDHNDKSASQMADLSWDYVYQVLEKQGYSKDLGERGDLLTKKMKSDRLTKTMSMPNKGANSAVKTAKKNEEMRKSDMFSSLELLKSRDDLFPSSSKLPEIKISTVVVGIQKNDEIKPASKISASPVNAIKQPVESKITKKGDVSVNTTWSCLFCTYLNKVNVDVCEMCSRSKARGSEVEPLVSGGRECPTCTLVNEKDAEQCSACNCSLKGSPTYI